MTDNNDVFASDHARRIIGALERYNLVNHQPAVDEPDNEFESLVNQHADLQSLLAEAKALLKPLEADEREMRDRLCTGLQQFFGEQLKEGVNNYTLSNKRVLKYTYKLDRKIETSMVADARALYDAATDRPAGVAFDDLLRVKYELAATPYKKVGADTKAGTAVSRMVVTKAAAPVLKVD